MKKNTILVPVLCMMLAVTACGGKTDTGTETHAVSETAESNRRAKKISKEAPVETEAVSETAPEPSVQRISPKEEAARMVLSKETFVEFFEQSIDDEIRNDFYIGYKDKTYYADDLPELYDAIAKDGGHGDVSLMGQMPDELDFEMISRIMSIPEEAVMGNGPEEETETDETESEPETE